jgi:hypothetical protein
VLFDKRDDLILGPAPIVVRRRFLADEAAVAAVCADSQIDARVARDLRIAKGLATGRTGRPRR